MSYIQLVSDRTHYGLQNRRVVNAITQMLHYLERYEPVQAQIREILEEFPSPVTYLESSIHMKETLGLPMLDAMCLSATPGLYRNLLYESYEDYPLLNHLSLMTSYVRRLYHNVRRETFYAVLLDGHGHRIHTMVVSRGNKKNTTFDLGMMLAKVVQLRARALVLCHNHPHGRLWPSWDDLECTKTALGALNSMGIVMLDHLIYAHNQILSMRSQDENIPSALWDRLAPYSPLMREWLDDLRVNPPVALPPLFYSIP